MMTRKFSGVDHDAAGWEGPYSYGNLWYRGRTTGEDRLVIGPSGGHIDLMLALTAGLPSPFAALYVLLVPRRGERPAGRYQVGRPVERPELEGFLDAYSAFFEGDGRHHVWVQCVNAPGLLVYDNHDVIYAYGPLSGFENVLRGRGFTERDFRFPAPHRHFYNAEFDEDEAAVMSYWEWRYFPLHESDDP